MLELGVCQKNFPAKRQLIVVSSGLVLMIVFERFWNSLNNLTVVRADFDIFFDQGW